MPTERRCFIVGHRGAARFEAENTIPSFTKALDLGADGVETGVCERIREDLTVALLCPLEETLGAVLSETRGEPLGRNVWGGK
jgi:hypothetical protein